ncbi:MAG: hypothetical protein QXG56_02435 [Candidatus Bathyarchaeia archaeon]
MPKPGYTSITLKSEVVRLLKLRAREKGLGVNELLIYLLELGRSCHGGVRGFESRPPHIQHPVSIITLF